MQQKTLSFTPRIASNKGAARALRRAAKIPSVIYGHGNPVTITVDAHEFNTKFKTVSESTIITLSSDGGETHDVLVKDYQEDTLTGRIMHIDFYEIEKGRLLRTHAAVHLEGTPVGVREGGILEVLAHEIEIECLPQDLPGELTLDITSLGPGGAIHVSDLPKLEGVRYLTSADQVVCTIVARREEVEVAAEEEEALLAEEGAEEEGEEAAEAEE